MASWETASGPLSEAIQVHDVGVSRDPMLPEKGLENDNGANHCFLNVVIQALWNLQSFRRRLLLAPEHPHEPFAQGFENRTEESTVDVSEVDGVYCALKSVFSGFDASEATTLPPDALRLALSKVYNTEGRFKIGEMEDATETIEALLGILHAWHVRHPNAIESIDDQCKACSSSSSECRHVSAAARVEEASNFGCHPLCLGHEVCGIEYVDLPRCTFCGATGEPSVLGSYLYSAYVTELLNCQSKPAGLTEAEIQQIASDPLSLLQDAVIQLTSRLAGSRPCSMQEALRQLCQREEGQKCGDCSSRKTMVMERWLTRRPHVFIVSLAWPSSSPGREAIWLVLQMIRPTLRLEEIFRTANAKGGQFQSASSSTDAVSGYAFHGLICYYGMHYIALFWCPTRKRWILFDDTCVREKEDWNSVANFIMTGQYVPTLVFYERLEDESPALLESFEELARQVDSLEDRTSSCVVA
eukprot:CAMPEP_0197632918 /NCGR_PEP_ID=MMETSP1338-20131121/9435_1 /TAXON_ID=43686 ORGANISM="Pelagodinium beii, Strain RCC1491" /NCGR_SAMPLE_ID=MMETSP1338 /ASSEMBLY_ACC=CAM_ASM_000754 /LENGTH=470 /DNA_ID=CAMNT_0043204495 /DNA_START=50 /DNA_END=1462 /DNA_ORIENTATION=-